MKKLGLLPTAALGLMMVSTASMACITCESTMKDQLYGTEKVGTMLQIGVGGNVDSGNGFAHNLGISQAYHTEGLGFWGPAARAWIASDNVGAGLYIDKHFQAGGGAFTLSAGVARADSDNEGWATRPAARAEYTVGILNIGYNHVFADRANHDFVDIGLKFAW